MTKKQQELIEALKVATEQGDIQTILSITEKLNKTKAKPKPKGAAKPGRPKKVKQEVVEEEEEVIPEENLDENVAHIAPARKLKTGRQISKWKKPTNIQFFDDTDEATEDIETDKLLWKGKKREPRNRPQAKKVNATCKVCNKTFKVSPAFIHYEYNEETKKREQMDFLCNGCRPS